MEVNGCILNDCRTQNNLGLSTIDQWNWFLQGAAINRSVLKHLSPAVVLVEEAAEILEPQVLASLNSNLQHLILIGDHHQLRPQVESYDLERW
jgi:superfamily I DNA and/or RNA helicase